MRRHLNLFGIVLAVSLSLSLPAFAAIRVHDDGCASCHKVSAGPRGVSNVCTPCHGAAATARGLFTSVKASDAMGSHPDHPLPVASGDQTSHFWGGATINKLEAGSASPSTTFYSSRMSISTNRVTCSICHDPHGNYGLKLLRKTSDNDLICQQCHTGFYQDYVDALKTHPIGDKTDPAKLYAAIQAANPTKFKVVTPDVATGILDTNTTSGQIKLVNGYVSCTSCHAVHFADSDSATADGLAQLETSSLAAGDGHLLKADGPTRNNKSALCQTCHTYQRHGNPASLEEDVGCLVCHSGHSYNGGVPNYFVLRNTLTTVTFGAKTNALYTPLTDAFLMNKGDGTGFCERCHGLSSAIPFHSLATGGTEDRYLQNCKDCHKHNEAGFDFSWKWSGSSAICGDCHGFPPYLNVEGDYKDLGADVGTKGGFAVMDGASDDSHSYATSGYSKSELETPHKSHAGGGEALGAYIEATDYKFAEGQGACTATCHDLNSHKQIDNTASFRNMVWGPIAKGNIAPNTVNLNPVYTTTGNGSCGTVYCHSNGGTRPAGVDRAKISTDFKFAPTNPVWATGDADIIGNATECATFCHGNSTTSMATGALATNRNNSVSHIKHLAKGYACNVCHKLTAAVGSTTVVLDTARLAPTGTHVNGKPDVGFDTTNDFDPGQAGTQLNIIKPASGDAGSGYTAVTGVCNVYCHSDGKAVRTYANVDWDQASTGACGTCHQYYSGGVPTGSGATLSATHGKHFAIAVTLTCDDCHGTNASTGTHTGHVNTLLTTVAGSCNTCHGIDGVETVPQWNAPMSNDYCISCHTGSSTGNIKSVMTAPTKQHATDRGHNRTTNYTSGNLPANKQCTSCHLTSITNHVNATLGDATHLAAAATSCTASCHGVGGSAVKDSIITHVGKVCTACHDPHGDTTQTNIYMIRSASATNYNGTVVFTNTGNEVTPLTATNSYDEDDDGLSGATGENNADDLCATCHTLAGGSAHNNRDNTAANHNMGRDCFTSGCHKAHTEATGAFKAGGGSACNSCHDNPPATGAHRNGYLLADSELHSFTAVNTTAEPRDDCAHCHTGAHLYTYDQSGDAGSGVPGQQNHGSGNRTTVLATSVGYATSGNFTYCGTACHISSATDGYWFNKGIGSTKVDWGRDAALNCNACHYYEATIVSNANNAAYGSRALTLRHDSHFGKQKACSACHTVPPDTSHVTTPGSGTDIEKIQSRAQAAPDEATVLAATIGTGSDPDPGNPTCAGAGIGLGCHNTKTTPAWNATAGSITCTTCHTPNGGAVADPVSGLHYGPITVSGKVHNNTLGTGCANCHSSLAAQTTHENYVFQGGNGEKTQMGLFASYTQTANDTGTCTGAGVATGCHSDAGNWARRWSTTARDVAGTAMCANCHGTFSAGWNSGVIHSEYATRGSGHSNVGTLTYPCTDCHVIGASNSAYLFTLGSNDWQVVELGTTKHGDNKLQMNSNTTGFSDAGARVGCATTSCHTVIDSTHDFQKSALFTTANTKLVTLLGDVPPVTCYNCHGGATVGTNRNNYWPDKAGDFEGGGNLSEDNGGRHQIHMERLAKSVYNETIAQLLTDNGNGTSDVKQQALCDYCHAGASNHGNKANLPAEVTTMYNLWLPKTADDATWSAASDGNCTNLNCHNGKATAATTNFTWYGTGTQNCLVCHNDITLTTAGTTGATHAAHTGSAAIYGKDITCASCHGGSPSWSPYAVATATAGNKHIDGQFKVGTAANAAITFAYGGSYTDYDTGAVGDCSTNLCHNNGKDAASYKNGGANYNWKTAFTGCAACHRTDFNLGSSHDPHMNAGFTSTFRSTVVDCTNCHDAASASSMAGMTAHMDGTVNIAGVTYTGNLAVNVAATYGTCSGSCHVDHLAAPKASPIWNRAPASGDNCTICHASPPADGRHAKHMAEADYVTSCGNCHSSATATTITSATHFNGSRNTAGTASVVYTAGDGTCTNNCHKVTDGRDWTSGGTSPVLFCTDCHQAGTIAASKGALPVSGLHNMTANGVQKHDSTLLGTNGCTQCHATPDPTHLNNAFVVDSGSNNDRFVNRANMFWTDGATNSGTCWDNGSTGLDYNAGAGCHRDNGVWKRLWSTNANLDSTANPDPGQLVCDVCHGQYQTLHVSSAGWREGSVHYRSGASAAENKGVTHNRLSGAANACEDCHAYDSAGGANHQNGIVNFDGNAGTPDTFTLTTGTSGWYCATCHNAASAEVSTDTASHTFPDSLAFTSRAYVVGISYPEGGCTGCHGNNGTGGFWPDSSTAHEANQEGEHGVHVLEIATKMAGGATLANKNATCNYCHPGNTHGGADGVVPADVSRTDLDNNGSVSGADPEQGTYMKKIVSPFATDTAGYWRRTPGTCSNVACHAGAPFTPHWYADATPPGNVTLTAVAGPVPRSIKVTWTAVGDDASLDGTAYKYDMRMGTSSAVAIDFISTSNYVQGVPTVKRMGTAQETIIHNVNPSTTYYFALRTYDRDGNFGGTANAGGYVSYAVSATPDTTPPVLTGSSTWYGLDSAKALDTSGTVKLSWTRAEDHSMPITYDIWWSDGTITYGAPQASTQDTSCRVSGLTNGQTYNFAVRAKDAYNNTDTNTVVLQAIPQGLSAVPKTNTIYYAQGAASSSNVTMQTAVHTTDGTNAGTTTFIGPTAFTSDTTIYANSFSANIDNGSTAAVTMQAELGYITGTTTWNSFSTPLLATDQTVVKRAIKVVTFKFNGAQRTMLGSWNGGAGAKLGVRVSVKSGGPIDSIGWGPTSKGGILSIAVQPVNVSPTTPTITANPVSGANVSFYWTASTDSADGVADTVHYDVYGSANGGTDGFPYVIATGLTTNATSGAPLVWDTQASGILTSSTTVQVRVEAGDTISGKTLSHTVATSGNLSVDNSGDNVAPGIITNLKAETRPKQGAIAISWTAPGDDGTNNGRAASYDIRWSNAVIDTELKYTNATQLVSEPYPDFGGNGQGYEALGLADGTYYFAIKAVDEGAKTSPLAYTTATTAAGPKCGICHSTPPDESASIGNHAKHGFTMAECGNCHGTEAATFTTAHQDGAIKLGWKTATPAVGTKVGYQVTYTQGGQTIYQDASPGGFNVDSADPGDKTDSGSCSGWSTLGVSGCHGPATSASWTAAATLPCSSCHGVASRPLDNYSHSFDDPSDDVKSAPPIDNHGYDGLITDPEAERKYVGAHIAHLNSSFRMSKGDSCRLCHGASRPGVSTHADGIIDIKLDIAAAGATATWTPGTAITAGTCGSMDPSACHPSTATPKWDSAAVFYCTNCHGFAGTTPSHVTDPNKLINLADNDADSGDPMPGNCTWCHVGGHPKDKKVTAITKASPAVVTTEHDHNLLTNDKVTIHTKTGMTEINNKTFLVTYISPTSFSLQTSDSTAYTTFDYGTWIEGNGTGIILVQNDSRVGINYLSGGIHLKANIGARGEVQSEAELCWSCHAPNNISEWGADSVPTNVNTLPGNGVNYNFGQIYLNSAGGTVTSNWLGDGGGAFWRSGFTPGFNYKDGRIRSTHSTDPTGSSALIAGGIYNYANTANSERLDAVNIIRCSNCHDVHNTNMSPMAADGLDPSGAPYLRGTWKSSPYKEDGAPQAGTTYTAQATALQPGFGYGAVPRAWNSTSQQMGGYWIDQNSGNPTAGWSYDSSAALCQLCHDKNVDNLNVTVDSPSLWLSGNGHANAALGGSGTGAANIFKNTITSNIGRQGTGGADVNPNPGAWMAFQITYTEGDNYPYGPRSSRTPNMSPTTPQPKWSELVFAWGNAVDATTIELGYHQFSCSKCHNPHASRLPKLMITNCLDTARNTWDLNYDDLSTTGTVTTVNTWTNWAGTTSSWATKKLSNLSTAQNCHRFVDVNNDNVPDESGWNKVTPW